MMEAPKSMQRKSTSIENVLRVQGIWNEKPIWMKTPRIGKNIYNEYYFCKCIEGN